MMSAAADHDALRVRMHADSTFSDSVTPKGRVPVTIRSAPSTFLICDFLGHTPAAGDPVVYAEAGAQVWVQESTFANNTADFEFAARAGAQFFSDAEGRRVEVGGGDTEAVPRLSAVGADVKVLAWTEDWIVDVEKVRAVSIPYQ